MADDPVSRRRKFRVISCTLAVGETGREPAAAKTKGDYSLEEMTAMALETLPARQRRAVSLVHGVAEPKVRPLRKVAEELGTTVQRVRHLEENALAAIRHLLYSQGARPTARPPAAPKGGFGNSLYRKLDEALQKLPRKEEEVLRLRFGFGFPRRHGIDSASAASGLSGRELRSLEGKGKRRLSGEVKFLLKVFGEADGLR